ncbi:MAG TPA: hypothetical protein DFS52_11210, partial [Myxococcales bacterium]|nr:hypothetical protein [Myxococcales bacterium]
HTLWGELAWQLGGVESFDLVREADASGTSPGKKDLAELLRRHAPCVVLIDELVAYVRQFPDGGQVLSGGSYDSNLSFIQALTEATKLLPNAVLLASLPESEAGSAHGEAALHALKKIFGRVQALWKPVDKEESFEIVRRRLFQPITDTSTRDKVCRGFFDAYAQEGAKLPSETHEARYLDRLTQAYPIHPEVFDRLYEDWSTLDSFQRTRGVLKLMAHVIHELWSKGNKDLLILPGSLPLYRGKTRNELLTHLPQGWDPVLDRDIDDDRCEAAELDTREGRFGGLQAARRVTRTTFFGSAPSSGTTRKDRPRGVDRARVLLGCLQPGQSSSVYGDALNRLADQLHYLNASGEKTLETTRFWFDTRANLRREMEDRKGRCEPGEVKGKLAEVLHRLTSGKGSFDGVHVFTPHSDVPDDGQLRLVLLAPEAAYSKQAPEPATDAALEYVRQNGAKPRFKGNRLLFLAADNDSLRRLRDAAKTALAWASIVEDIAATRLVIDQLQAAQAKKESETAEAVVQRAARDCYRWMLCPLLQAATDREPIVEAFSMNPGASSFTGELARVCEENELVISAWAPVHLRSCLQRLYWKDGKSAVGALTVWEDMQKYLYLPRLRRREVFEKVILVGAGSEDFFGTAYGQQGERLEGFKLGDANVQLDGTLLLIEPGAAKAYREKLQAEKAKVKEARGDDEGGKGSEESSEIPPQGVPPLPGEGELEPKPGTKAGPKPAPRSKSFIGSVEVNAAKAKMDLVTIAEEIIAVLASDPNANVRVTVEIQAEFPNGADENVKRAVGENAKVLGFTTGIWE